MRLFTGKRIGQSGGELAAAVSFSLFLHLVAFLAALLLSFHFSSRILVPNVYSVKLVGLPADVPLTTPAAPAAPAPKAPEPKHKAAAPKAAKPAVHAVPAPKSEPAPKAAMPELGTEKPKPEKAAEAPAPSASAAPSAAAGKKEAVAVTPSSSSQFQSMPELREYLGRMTFKIQDSWNRNIPPGAKALKARVSFKVVRSGLVADVKLTEPTGNFYFDQAAMRAILASSPFPPLPEGLTSSSETFVVDLQPEK